MSNELVRRGATALVKSNGSLTNDVGGAMLKSGAGMGAILLTATLLPGGVFFYFLLFLVVGGFLKLKG